MRQITIIGAGLVGSLWAYILKKQNYDVTVFEKRQNPKDLHMQAGRSINLILTSRGLHGLEIADLTKKILPLTTPVYGRGIHQKSGEKLFQPYGRNKTECNYSVSRWELNKATITSFPDPEGPNNKTENSEVAIDVIVFNWSFQNSDLLVIGNSFVFLVRS